MAELLLTAAPLALLPLAVATNDTTTGGDGLTGHPPDHTDDDSSSINDVFIATIDFLFYKYPGYIVGMLALACVIACCGGCYSYKIYARCQRGSSFYNAITGNHAAEIKANFAKRRSTVAEGGGAPAKGGKGKRATGKGAPADVVSDLDYDQLEADHVPLFMRGTSAAATMVANRSGTSAFADVKKAKKTKVKPNVKKAKRLSAAGAAVATSGDIEEASAAPSSGGSKTRKPSSSESRSGREPRGSGSSYGSTGGRSSRGSFFSRF